MHINFISDPENCRNPLQEQRVEAPKRLRLRGAKRGVWISKCIILPSAPSSAKIALISAFKCSKREKIPTSTNRIKIVYIGIFPTFALFSLKKHGKFPTFCMLKHGKIPCFTKKRSLSSSAATADLLIKYLSSSSRSLIRDFPEFFRNPLQGQRMEVPAFGGFQPRKSQARKFNDSFHRRLSFVCHPERSEGSRPAFICRPRSGKAQKRQFFTAVHAFFVLLRRGLLSHSQLWRCLNGSWY